MLTSNYRVAAQIEADNTLPVNSIEASSQISDKCNTSRGNSFTVTGRGGLPSNPTVELTTITLWSDLRIPQRRKFAESIAQNKVTPYSPIIEATGFIKDELGRVHLVANVPNTKATLPWQNTAMCRNVKTNN